MDPYLIKILNEKNRVIIPDFGAFIVKQKNPRKIIFNEFLQYNDGALVDAISREEKIDRDAAMRNINVYVNELRKKLSSGKTVNIAGLGQLSQNPTGKIDLDDTVDSTSKKVENNDKTKAQPTPDTDKAQAEEPKPVEETPSESIDLTEDISQVTSKKEAEKAPVKPAEEIINAQAKNEVVSENKPDPTPSPKVANKPYMAEKKVEPRPVSRIPHSGSTPHRPPSAPVVERDHNNRTRKIVLWVLAMLIINGAIIGYFLFSDEIGKMFNKKDAQSIEQIMPLTELEEQDALTDSLAANADTPANEALLEANTTMTVDEEETTQPDRQITGKKYYIVAGVFQVEQNADKMANDLRKRGFNADKFGKVGAYHAVSYDVFPTKAEADQYLKQIHAKEDPEAWIKIIH